MLAKAALLTNLERAVAARLITTSVALGGKIALKTSTSDDGTPDAESVWETLKDLRFQPTEEFQNSTILATANKVNLTNKDKEGKPIEIVVKISGGGIATPRKLKAICVPKDNRGGEWKLDAAAVDQMFRFRLINRELAAKLRNPRDLKSK